MNESSSKHNAHKLSNNFSRLLIELAKDFEHRALRKCHQRGHTKIRRSHTSLFSNLGFGAVRLSELAERAGITQQAMGKMVKEMERVGYVKRHIDHADKRAKIIQLTKLGERLVNDSLEIVDEITAEYIQSIGSDEFDSLELLLNHTVNKLGLRFLTESWDNRP